MPTPPTLAITRSTPIAEMNLPKQWVMRSCVPIGNRSSWIRLRRLDKSRYRAARCRTRRAFLPNMVVLQGRRPPLWLLRAPASNAAKHLNWLKSSIPHPMPKAPQVSRPYEPTNGDFKHHTLPMPSSASSISHLLIIMLTSKTVMTSPLLIVNIGTTATVRSYTVIIGQSRQPSPAGKPMPMVSSSTLAT